MNVTFWSRCVVAALAGLMLCSSIASAGTRDNSIIVVSTHPQDASSDGLCVYVKVAGKVMLFCAGGKADSLLQDLDAANLEPAPIEAVVFLTRHSDDLQGLTDLLNATTTPPKVYVSATAAQEILRQKLQAVVVSVKKPTSVLPGAWLLGPMHFENEGDTVFEQVLVVDRPDGLVVVVSCDNPGIIPVVDKVREVFGYRKIKVVAGGFHLQGASRNEIRETSLRLQQKGVQSLGLSSCVGNAALKILRQEWGDRVVSFDRGDSIDF